MKVIKIISAIALASVAIFFIAGVFIPKSYSVSRSLVVNAPDSLVYTNIVNFDNFLKWNPWSRMEPTARVQISGMPGVPGHLYKWKGEDLGTGFMKVRAVSPYTNADFQLTFQEPFQSEANNRFTLEKVATGTKVTWTMEDHSDATADKWMFLMMDNMLGKDFESGLQNLKELSEQQ